jgi:hypothetical protein
MLKYGKWKRMEKTSWTDRVKNEKNVTKSQEAVEQTTNNV